jgi:hypothetical protein
MLTGRIAGRNAVSEELRRYLQRRRGEALERAKHAEERAEVARDEGDEGAARSHEAAADVQRAIARTYDQRLDELASRERSGSDLRHRPSEQNT